MPVHKSADRFLRLARMTDDRAAKLKQLVVHYVDEARLHGASWTDVGIAFGVTRQSAHERFSANSRRNRRTAGSISITHADPNSDGEHIS